MHHPRIMAAQTRPVFLFFLFTLITNGLASSLDATENNTTDEKVSANMNKMFDAMLPTIKNFILDHGLEPTRLDDFSENLPGIISHNIIFELRNGWIEGLSVLKRANDVILSYENKVFTLDGILEFDALDFKYEYLLKDLLIARKGDLYGLIQNMQLRIVLKIDMINHKVIPLVAKIVRINKIDLMLKGHKIDPIINAVIKAFIGVFRKKVTNIVENEVSNILQTFVDKINEMIPQPDQLLDSNNIFDHLPISFLFRLV